MTYVVTENCIKCKYMDCVEVCPVDCFYAGENMLVIHPDECIDCGVCEPECPAQAIKPDTEPGLEDWLQLNCEYAAKWPNITAKEVPPADAKEWDGVPGKLAHFSPDPHQEQSSPDASSSQTSKEQAETSPVLAQPINGEPIQLPILTYTAAVVATGARLSVDASTEIGL